MGDAARTVRWGILGTARIATKVGAAIHAAAGGELLGIASRSADRAAAWAAEHGAGRTYDSYQALLDDPEIDAVYIPLPPAMHREWTIAAAERGKHVLCEKPLACTVAETEEMAAACRQHRVQLMDGVMWLHHPRAADMQAVIAGGRLGELRRVTSAFTFCWPELPRNEFRLVRSMGGGSLLDLGWYCVGAALWAFGERPLRVHGFARMQDDIDMNFSGILSFPADKVAAFDCGFDTGMRKWLEVAGTDGSLVCDDFTRPWNEEKPRFWMHDAGGKAEEFHSASPVQEVAMIEAFQRIVAEGVPDESWTRRALETQRVCEALDRSARNHQPVELAEE